MTEKLAKYQGNLQEIIPEATAVRVFKDTFGHMNTIFLPDTVNSFACYELLFSYEPDEMDMFDNRYSIWIDARTLKIIRFGR